jgi:hypothetical protein
MRIIYPGFPLFALVFFWLPQLTHAQCPQICDGNKNTALGDDTLSHNTSTFNTAIGNAALSNNTTGGSNTATGHQALSGNTAGGGNTANGASALALNTTGNYNTANGVSALALNTIGSANTASGNDALFSNTTGNNNAANGFGTLLENTTGSFNAANGFNALFSNTTGNNNTASGCQAMNGDPANGSTGANNTATGYQALFSYTTGGDNTAAGYQALSSNTIGNNNTATGFSALVNNTTGNNNIAVGSTAGENLTTGSNNIDVGNSGVPDDSRAIRIGTRGTHAKTFIAGISGVTVPGGVGVIVGSNGQLGTLVSSARFKEAIKPMDKASEVILSLQPVTFRYKKDLDPQAIPQFGLVSEQVEKVDPDLVARDSEGKPHSVRYEAVNAMLLNEFLKEHRKVAEQAATITELRAEMEATSMRQQEQIGALTVGLQKVNTQLEKSSLLRQTIASNH